MPDATSTGLPLGSQAQASAAAAARFNVTSLQIGLVIGFGPVFLFGAAAWTLDLFGSAAGPLFAQTLLWTQIITISALVGFVLFWERRPLGSLGIRKASYADVEFGLGLAIVLLVLEIAVGTLVPILYESEIGFISRRMWLPLSGLFRMATQLGLFPGSVLVIATVIVEELAVRGYAFTRLRQLTQSTVMAAGIALMLDLLAHAPLWGLDYTICMVPAELILMWLFVSERRLLPCVVGHLGLDLLPLTLLALHIQVVPPAMNPHTARAMELAERQQYGPAIREFDKALRENPNDAETYAQRGTVYDRQGDFDHAIKDLSEAIRLDPTMVGPYINRSYSYRSKGNLPMALADINSAVKLEPSNSDLLYRRGYIYARMGDHDKAIDDFTAMIALSPHEPLGYKERASEYAAKEDYKDAIADADSAVKLEAANASNYSLRAAVEARAHEYDKAIADYAKAFALDRSDLQYAYAQANLYKYLGRIDEELAFCKKLAADYPNEADAHACVADGYFRKGDLKSATAAMSRAIEVRPDAAMLYSQRATLEIAASHGPEAQADIKKVPALSPNDPQANNYAAWLLSTSPMDGVRDGKAAIAFATKGCELTSWKDDHLLDTLAAAYAENGDFAEAVKWEQYALKIAEPSQPAPILKAMRDRLALYQKCTAYREAPK